jgi:hypothetical protein
MDMRRFTQDEQYAQAAAEFGTASPLTPKPAPPKQRTVIDVPAATLQSYAGVYALDTAPDFKITATFENGGLFVQATGQGKLPVFPESETTVFYKVVDAQITFSPAIDGKPAFLTLHQGGANQKASKTN